MALCTMRSLDTTIYYDSWNNIPSCDDLTVGKVAVSPIEGGQKNIWWFEACFGHFLACRGPQQPPRGPQWFQMDDLAFHEKSGYNNLLWDDVTVGKLGVSSMEGGQKNIWWFETCFGRFLAERGPQWPPQGPKWMNLCSMRSRNTKLYYGMIYVWENWV